MSQLIAQSIKARALLLIVVAIQLAGCASGTRRDLQRISANADPTKLGLEDGFNDCVRRAHLDDLTEVGIVQCRDGSSACFVCFAVVVQRGG